MTCRDWRDCRNMLLKRFKAMLECVGGGGEGGEGGEVLKMLLDIVDKENAHNYSLLLLWASQSNAIPVSLATPPALLPSPAPHLCRLCSGPYVTFSQILIVVDVHVKR